MNPLNVAVRMVMAGWSISSVKAVDVPSFTALVMRFLREGFCLICSIAWLLIFC
jgi:hypothetical protein